MHRLSPAIVSLSALIATTGCLDDVDPAPAEGAWSVEDDPAEVTREAPLSWCAPSPVAYDRSLVPALPMGVRYEGFCGHDAPTLEADPTHTLSLDTDARVLRVDEGDPSLGASSQTTFRFDAQGRVIEVTRVGSQGFYGVGEGTSTYALNARGEVVHKTASQPFEGTTLVKVQEWDGRRLLSRTEREGSDDGRVVRRWRWTWEGDRMVRGELVEDPDGDAPRVHSSAWTYDDAGRPASVERAVDGVALERASWVFREDDTLARRTLWSRSPESVAAERGGDAARWALTRGLDDHQTEDAPGAQPEPWRAATSHLSDDGACRRVPRGVHGYPDHEPEYHLALSVAERPGRAGFAYGANTFMWSYGNDSWFGHDGVASDWLGQSTGGVQIEELEVTLDYSARGVMTREVATLTHGGRVLELERDRTLDAAGGVLEDTATVSTEGMTHTRTLRFERDANGAILARDLLDGDGARIARQTWERDDRGRATRHVIESVDFASPPEWMPEFHAPRSRTPSESYVWFWRHEGEHVVERGVEGGDTQRLTYDDEGRLTSRVGEYEQHSRSVWITRDDEGRITEECQGSHDTRYTSCVATTYDAAGRVAHRVQTTTTDGAPGDPSVIEHNLHVCE
jgi:hypothetical protein